MMCSGICALKVKNQLLLGMATIIVVRTTTTAPESKKGEMRKKCYLHTTSGEQVTREFPEVFFLRFFFPVCRYSSSSRISSLQSFSI